MLKPLSRWDIRNAWSIVLKAAIRSSDPRITQFLSSTSLSISLRMRLRALSVEWGRFCKRIGLLHPHHRDEYGCKQLSQQFCHYVPVNEVLIVHKETECEFMFRLFVHFLKTFA